MTYVLSDIRGNLQRFDSVTVTFYSSGKHKLLVQGKITLLHLCLIEVTTTQ